MGWIFLAVVFTLLIATALLSYFAPRDEEEQPQTELAAIETQVKLVFGFKPVIQAFAPPGQEVKPAESLRKELKRLEEMREENPEAARLLVATRFEANLPLREADLEALDGTAEVGTALRNIYDEEPPTTEEALRAQETLPDDSLALMLAQIHALERAGEDAPLREELFSIRRATFALGAMMAGMLLTFGGLAAWAGYISARRGGNLKPAGHPAEPLSAGEADRFALRVAVLMLFFTMMQIVLGIALEDEPNYVRFAVPGLVLIPAVVFIYSSTRFEGIKITLERVGFNRNNLGKNILWGFGGWLANIPLVILSAIITSQLLRFLPTPTHPATDLIQADPDVVTVLALVFAASIVAPFWEEVVFRGTLLPGISRATKSVAWGVVLSSFMFAAIHPQGIVLWLGLATVGAMAAALTYQTGSLVPAVVLHALHNFATLMMGLLVSSF